ncbi:hypothetical protein LTR62_005047 [Meristemomyces frigidus]|uniref:Transmembrane protein n=1 Tax=Meristemomyces frigidus TaxID=1508187 RepID=A0AAN7TR28_9PEZI|nr:hypothetical protein LTR62_005047 [Meristemomyces frigidus]
MAQQHNYPDYAPYSYRSHAHQLNDVSTSTNSNPTTAGVQTNSQPSLISTTAIAWIVIVAVIVTAATVTALYLLCSCCRSRKSRSVATRPLDDRNHFHPWNPDVSPYPAPEGESELELQPLAKAAVRPAGRQQTSEMVEPEIMEEANGGEMGPPPYRKERGTRYYGNREEEGLWARISQRFSTVGKAY